MSDKAWKKFERRVAKLLGGERVHRMGDFSQIDTDVRFADSNIKLDCKLRKQHEIHRIFKEVKGKYCKLPDDVMIVATRVGGDPLILVTIDMDLFKRLWDHWVAYAEHK